MRNIWQNKVVVNFIQEEALGHSYCSNYSILFLNNLIIFFNFDILEDSNYVNDDILVSLLLN